MKKKYYTSPDLEFRLLKTERMLCSSYPFESVQLEDVTENDYIW